MMIPILQKKSLNIQKASHWLKVAWLNLSLLW